MSKTDEIAENWRASRSVHTQAVRRMDVLVILDERDRLRTALETVLAQYKLFVGPDDAIANATKAVARAALEGE